ncbi:hypothetical protein HPY42_01605 [Coprothermobacteraceae bacterium]|nr:hypothetical protein [Coprothermobacteraceae bacterium]
MLEKARVALLALLMLIGSIFGKSTIGPFTPAEVSHAEQVYQRYVEDTLVRKLQQVTASTALHSVGFVSAELKQVLFDRMEVTRNYNLVLETRQGLKVYYRLHLVDGDLTCYTRFNATAVFFKEHVNIRPASLYVVPVGPSKCSAGLLEASRQNH